MTRPETATLNRKCARVATLFRNESTYGSVRTDPGKKYMVCGT